MDDALFLKLRPDFLHAIRGGMFKSIEQDHIILSDMRPEFPMRRNIHKKRKISNICPSNHNNVITNQCNSNLMAMDDQFMNNNINYHQNTQFSSIQQQQMQQSQFTQDSFEFDSNPHDYSQMIPDQQIPSFIQFQMNNNLNSQPPFIRNQSGLLFCFIYV